MSAFQLDTGRGGLVSRRLTGRVAGCEEGNGEILALCWVGRNGTEESE